MRLTSILTGLTCGDVITNLEHQMARERTALELKADELERDAYEAIQKAILLFADAEEALMAEEAQHSAVSITNQDRLKFYGHAEAVLHGVESELHQTMRSKPRANSMDPFHY